MLGRVLDLALQHRKLITLGVVCGVAAGLYAAHASVKRQRDSWRGYAELLCATAGVPLTRDTAEPCALRVAALARFERDTARGTAEALTGHLDEQAQRAATSAEQAREHATAARAAKAQLEEVSRGTPQGSELGGDYWAAVNRAAGLRP